MNEVLTKSAQIPKSGTFRWEIGLALLVKLLLLTGLWYWLFHQAGSSPEKADVAALFTDANSKPELSVQPNQEKAYVRR